MLKHKRQTLANNCVSACIAMILDLPVELVTDEFHQDYIDCKTDPFNYLTAKGLNVCLHNITHRRPENDRIYIISVPSLNVKSGLHCVVADCYDDMWTIYDPQDGNGLNSYTSDGIVGYSMDLSVDRNELATYLRARHATNT